jgi:maltose alpha-D-glucosyltransferase/alpha-amylase
MRNLSGRVLQTLAARIDTLPADVQADARELVGLEAELLGRFRRIIARKMRGLRIRCHGDYHLGQVLFTGNDFVITDFEGEPIRPLSERRMKRSPLRDVAGMLRSFHYAAYSAPRQEPGAIAVRGAADQEGWVRAWYARVSATFLRAYLHATADAPFLPTDDDELGLLLDAYVLEKAVYELGYELNNRPDWAIIPVRGVLEMLHQQSRS